MKIEIEHYNHEQTDRHMIKIRYCEGEDPEHRKSGIILSITDEFIKRMPVVPEGAEYRCYDLGNSLDLASLLNLCSIDCVRSL